MGIVNLNMIGLYPETCPASRWNDYRTVVAWRHQLESCVDGRTRGVPGGTDLVQRVKRVPTKAPVSVQPDPDSTTPLVSRSSAGVRRQRTVQPIPLLDPSRSGAKRFPAFLLRAKPLVSTRKRASTRSARAKTLNSLPSPPSSWPRVVPSSVHVPKTRWSYQDRWFGAGALKYVLSSPRLSQRAPGNPGTFRPPTIAGISVFWAVRSPTPHSPYITRGKDPIVGANHKSTDATWSSKFSRSCSGLSNPAIVLTIRPRVIGGTMS